ncbi:MAG: 30S ribosomal protein S6 [Clostridia bacterium]|nr:30S ribosomal protein S6 [Clostridia bacterium]
MEERKYEAMLVFSVKDGEEKATALADKFKELIEKNGKIENYDVWGKRKLAYLINDEPEGFYVLINYTAKPDFPVEFERNLKITEGVLRFLNIVEE